MVDATFQGEDKDGLQERKQTWAMGEVVEGHSRLVMGRGDNMDGEDLDIIQTIATQLINTLAMKEARQVDLRNKAVLQAPKHNPQ